MNQHPLGDEPAGGKKVEVITDKDYYIHVSGHPARDELKRMYELVRPQIAVPTHGEPYHIHEHSKLARSLGVKETVEAHNGAVVWLEQGEASVLLAKCIQAILP